MKKKLNIIGAGRAGKTLSRLWQEHGIFQITAVCNRSKESALLATQFIGRGEAINNIADLPAADIFFLAVPDDEIQHCCDLLSKQKLFDEKTIVFHASGSLSSAVLASAKEHGAAIASIHPAKSFADAQIAKDTFSNTPCAAEGDELALNTLIPAFQQIGGKVFSLPAEAKTLYHCSMVMACNYLVTLLQRSIDVLAQTGIQEPQALALLQPLVQETVNNVFQLGPKKALTGPIARGDYQTVEKHLSALEEKVPEVVGLYRVLGESTAGMVRNDNTSSKTSITFK